jgi:Tfp pilus assembly protein PilV
MPRGMTLIEVLISFAILVTGLVSIFAVLNAGFRAHNRAIREMEASGIAESVAEELRARFSSEELVRSDEAKIWHPYPENSENPTYSYNVTVVPLVPRRNNVIQGAADREYFVRIKVKWMSQGDDQFIQIDTIMFRRLKDSI